MFKHLGQTSARLQAQAVQTMQALALIFTEPDNVSEEAVLHIAGVFLRQLGLADAHVDMFWEAVHWCLKATLADIWTNPGPEGQLPIEAGLQSNFCVKHHDKYLLCAAWSTLLEHAKYRTRQAGARVQQNEASVDTLAPRSSLEVLHLSRSASLASADPLDFMLPDRQIVAESWARVNQHMLDFGVLVLRR